MNMFSLPHPEELRKTRAEYCEGGVKQGKNVLAICFNKGVVLLSENEHLPNKYCIDELHDRIAIAGVGEQSSYDQIRQKATLYAAAREMQFDPLDVNADSVIRDVISPYLREVFFNPYTPPKRVKFLLSELTDHGARFYEVRYDGATGVRSTNQPFAAIGKDAESIEMALEDLARQHDFTLLDLAQAVGVGLGRLEAALRQAAQNPNAHEQEKKQAADDLKEFESNVKNRYLEIAVLDRTVRDRRVFGRVDAATLSPITE
ncbi:hypothetical protein HY772_08250 [Candidatus Woesearchaeota archaeon]|nr:hypothetical protein [Candidatus Woesearchaeota archaeon]